MKCLLLKNKTLYGIRITTVVVTYLRDEFRNKLADTKLTFYRLQLRAYLTSGSK